MAGRKTGKAPCAQDKAISSRTRPSTWAHFRILLAKDLRQELRTRDMLTGMVLYAVLVLIVYGAALGMSATTADITAIGGGLLWVLVVLTSLLGLNRSFAKEQEAGALQGIMLVPLDRSVIFLAKAAANLIFLLAVEIVAVPVFWFLFLADAQLAASAPLIAVPLVLGSIGMAGVGTLLSTITSNTRGRDVMLALLFIPVIFPLLYACVAASTACLLGPEGFADTLRICCALAAGYDIVMILVSWVLYDFVVSA